MIREKYPMADEFDKEMATSGLDVFTKALMCRIEECFKLFASGGSIKKHYKTVYRIKVSIQYNIAAV